MNEYFMSPSGVLGIVKRYWIYVVLGIFIVNSLILDVSFLFFLKPLSSQTTLPATVPGNVSLPNALQNSCPASCINQMNLIFTSQKKITTSSAIQPTVGLTSTPSITPTDSPTPIPTQIKIVKEFFVPLGVGSGSSADWAVIDGIGAKIDPSDYGNIKQITFEVTARIPTGNQTIWIRLYNASTFQSVSGSEMTLSGGTATLLTSSPITLASGNNLYQIQMKTQLKYTANIDMARIRIKTD